MMEFDVAEVHEVDVSESAECRDISAERVASTPVATECRLRETLEVAGRVQLVGDVENVHIDEFRTSVLTPGRAAE